MTSLHSCSPPPCWFISLYRCRERVSTSTKVITRTIRVVVYTYIYIFTRAMFPLDAMPDPRAVARGGISSAVTNFYSVLSPLFITEFQRRRDARSKVFAARSAVAAKYWAKSLTKNRWGRRVGPAIKFAKRILVRGGNHSDGATSSICRQSEAGLKD